VMLRGDTQDRLIGWCRQALRFVLPVECLTCGMALSTDPVPFFCTACWQNIRPLHQPACSSCDQPFVSQASTAYTPDHQCQNCQERPPAFQRAWTLFPYLPPLREAICSFKYRGKHTLARPLARLMISALPAEIDVDMIVPVPLHPTRLRAREFNQSLLLADQLSRYLTRPVSTTNLVRITATDPQTTLTRQARLRNLRKAFAVHRPQDLTKKRILFVDDVFTTGTTLNECAKVLRKAGTGPVFALTLARTVDMGCCRFQRHRVRCMNETGGEPWSDESLRVSSSWRR
jgi:ComF family protein